MTVIAAAEGATAAELADATAVILAAQLVQSVRGSSEVGGSVRLIPMQVAAKHGTSFPLNLLMMVTAGVNDNMSAIESAAIKLPATLRAVLEPAIEQLQLARMDANPDPHARALAQWKQVAQRLTELRASEATFRAATEEEEADVEDVVNTLMAVSAAGCSDAVAAATASRYLVAAAEAAAAGILLSPLPLHACISPRHEALAALAAATTRLQESFAEVDILQPILRDAQVAVAMTGWMSETDESRAGAARRRPAAAAAPASVAARTGGGAGYGESTEAGDEAGK
jgi:hypothetical protein